VTAVTVTPDSIQTFGALEEVTRGIWGTVQDEMGVASSAWSGVASP
jgi:hypothetical protein